MVVCLLYKQFTAEEIWNVFEKGGTAAPRRPSPLPIVHGQTESAAEVARLARSLRRPASPSPH